MTKFYWSDYEIAYSYRTAKDKDEQIVILSELNDVTPEEMTWKLWELGCIEKQPPLPRKRARKTRRETVDKQLSKNKFAARIRTKREEWRENGLCLWCGRAQEEGRSLCKRCLEKSRAASIARRNKKKEENKNKEESEG